MPALGLPAIMGMGIAALVGAIGQVLIQLPPLWREGFRYRPLLDPRDAALRDVLILMGPGTIGLAATQVNLFVSTLLATSQGTGAASWLSYAFRLTYLPIGLFGVSIATAALPAVSRHAALNDLAGVRATVSRGLTMMLMLNVPATLGLLTLARPIVEVLFEHGRFTPADSQATAAALRLYAVGLLGYSAARIVSPTFYAIGRSRTAVAVSVGAIAGNVLLSILFVALIGFRGLALATALAALGNGGLLVLLLRKPLGGLEGSRLAQGLARITAAAAAMALAAWTIETATSVWWPGDQWLMRATRLGAAIGGGLAVLGAAARLLHITEFDEALRVVKGRLTRDRSAAM
jgi:putative peptidoglycan lipid II flippase